jgi:hypothetical protein
MWHPRTFPDFLVINEIGETSLFRHLLGDLNVVLLARYREAFHGPAVDMLTQLLGENAGCHSPSVRGFEIRAGDVACPVHETCQVLSRQSDGTVTTICDATGAIHGLMGVSDGDRIFVIDPHGVVTNSGTPHELERLSLQLALDAAMLTSRSERGPPVRRKHCA